MIPFLLCTVLAQAQAQFDEHAFLQKAEEATEERIAELRASIPRLRDRRLKRAAALEIRYLERDDVYALPEFSAVNMEAGDVGRLVDVHLDVIDRPHRITNAEAIALQILDEENVRAELRTVIAPAIVGRQAIGGGVRETGVWFSAWDTTELREDERFEVDACVRVLGNRTYRTAFNV